MLSWKTNLLYSFIVATLLTYASYVLASYFNVIANVIAEVNWLEVFSVWTSYSCTWLCVKQSRFNYPIGGISVAALSVLFYNQALYASMALNIYLIPALLWGWLRWRPDSDTRPVTTVALVWWPVYLGLAASVWYGLTYLSAHMGSPLPAADSFILAGSILAQFLLDQKKLETWMMWAVVNVAAIATYWQAGLVLVAIQFVFFLGNTIYGYVSWRKTMTDPLSLKKIFLPTQEKR